MKGYIINRSGNYKYIFKRNIAPGEKIQLNLLYKSYVKKFTVEQFIQHVQKNLSNIKGFDVEEIEINTPEAPREIAVQEELAKINITPSSITPKKLSEMEYDDKTRTLIDTIDSTRILNYAKTILEKKNGNKHFIKALENRASVLKQLREKV